ncbi:hypothetical protein ACHAW6_002724 [Cyclotella cf. meneghiniana]
MRTLIATSLNNLAIVAVQKIRLYLHGAKLKRKAYFRGWNGLTSDRKVKKVHMDKQETIMCSTRSSLAGPSPQELDHMITYEQTPHNDKTNMVFMIHDYD